MKRTLKISTFFVCLGGIALLQWYLRAQYDAFKDWMGESHMVISSPTSALTKEKSSLLPPHCRKGGSYVETAYGPGDTMRSRCVTEFQYLFQSPTRTDIPVIDLR